MSDEIATRNADVLARWRDGESFGAIGETHGISIEMVRNIVAVLTTREERTERRAKKMSEATREYTEDRLVGLLQACAEDLGRSPASGAFDRWAGKYLAQLVMWRFGSWATGLETAGLVSNGSTPDGVGERTYDDDKIEVTYRRIRAITESPPTLSRWNELVAEDEPHEGTIRRRFGGWVQFRHIMEEKMMDPDANARFAELEEAS